MAQSDSLVRIAALLLVLVWRGPQAHEAEMVYRIGVEDIDYYPIHNFTSHNRQGFLPDLLETFAEQNHLIFEFVPLPVQRFNDWYEQGRIDLKIPDSEKWSVISMPRSHLSDPIITFCEETIVLKQNAGIRAADIQRLGTLIGFTPSPKWQGAIRQGTVELVEDPSLKVLTRMLVNGMVDGLDLSIDAVRHQLRVFNIEQEEVVVARNIPAGVLNYRMSTEHHPEIITLFNRFLAQHHDYIGQLVQSYQISQLPQCQPVFSAFSAVDALHTGNIVIEAR